MIISLCGFMGAGKSTVGKFLSNYLGTDFIDLDNMLEKRFGCSISDYFAKNGEEPFRAEEYDALSEIFTESKKNLVLALGLLYRVFRGPTAADRSRLFPLLFQSITGNGFFPRRWIPPWRSRFPGRSW